ncbi:DNA-3-methyladenine glycosylase I [Leuconostocaceae bacterium ESL0958]|nr:DNA-3-methyladenine glycosylase I [Leuconostocaceae bacterium ESL0958]
MKPEKQDHRCAWAKPLANGDLTLVQYHDQEYGRPVHSERALFELLTLEIFQAGLSWRTVLLKRPAFRRAFASFDINRVADFTSQDVDWLLGQADIIRNRAKIEATVKNARLLVVLQRKGETLTALIRDLRRQAAEIPADELAVLCSQKMKLQGFSFTGPVVMDSYLKALGVIPGHEPDCDFA